jgi:hypothetical protein
MLRPSMKIGSGECGNSILTAYVFFAIAMLIAVRFPLFSALHDAEVVKTISPLILGATTVGRRSKI